MNSSMKARAGRLLARCHAALGQHQLAVAALDAALEGAETGELLLSRALVTREKVRLGTANDGSGNTYWDAQTGRRRLQEVVGRAASAGENRGRLEELLAL